MFSKLISRNSKRSRKENGLFFASLVISIVAFYIILSLSNQDVMIFLSRMESDAVSKLLTMIPVFYSATLVILFFLIYYASKFQLERRRREFGVYLMMGMRRTKLFAMLMAEDFYSSVAALIIGLPVAVLLSEIISLVTARCAGMGIIGHHVSFSAQAVLWTAAGFFIIKLVAFLILSGKISRQEIGDLLVDTPEGTKKQYPAWCYGVVLVLGILCLVYAYSMGIGGTAWAGIQWMGKAILLGLLGTLMTFWGIRFPLGLIAKADHKDRQLHVFTFRQIQETVIHRSNLLAVCSILILGALCFFGAGVAMVSQYSETEQHALDYTFKNVNDSENGASEIQKVLKNHSLDSSFSALFEMRIGHIKTAEDYKTAFQMEQVMSALEEAEPSQDRDILLNNLGYATSPYIISLTSYNKVLQAAGLPELELDSDEAGVYMGEEFVPQERKQLMNSILATSPEAMLDGQNIHLTGVVQTANLVTDCSITLSFALILPDERFEYYTQGEHDCYINGVLSSELIEKVGLMTAISDMNEQLDEIGLSYESYLQNMGRRLFYMVASSYITLYLAIIFLIVANTIIGVQFLIGQQKSKRRYKTLIRLGTTYEVLCKSAKKQINWYFGIPTVVAAMSSLFAVRGLLTGMMPYAVSKDISAMLLISGAMILILCVIECIYMSAVKRTSNGYLLTLMVPDREE